MCHTMILADQSVPDCLTRTTHTHRKWEQAELSHSVRVLWHEGLIDTHARVVVDIAGLGHTNDGVDEKMGLASAGGTDGQLAVGAVHRVAGLEGDNAGPVEFFEVRTEFGGCVWKKLN
ncbi:hypothetical protein BC937DRAFT_91942 [Endogone sp. FLAS-F59071]|nr:hypothetical protein BC937DRAFT_91942 [Endogone sp. FLAS-F59071]|eukprot:RUS21650.1 hypothetical protein BC937DRAFT_91942 [Endogone sp. FLAS-F59071]